MGCLRSVVGSLRFTTDHRLILARFKFETKGRKFYHKPRSLLQFDRRIFTAKIHATTVNFKTYDTLSKDISSIGKESMIPVQKVARFSAKTMHLFSERKKLRDNANTAQKRIEFSLTSKALRVSIHEDLKRKHLEVVRDAVRYGMSTRRAIQSSQIGRSQLTQLNKPDGSVATSKSEMSSVVQTFYNELYKRTLRPTRLPLRSNEPFLEFLPSEVTYAIRKLKENKSAGPDSITAEMLKSGIDIFVKPLCDLFNKWVIEEIVPNSLPDSVISLIFKKGSQLEISNYRPIALLNLVYKVFTSVIDTRIEGTLNSAQPHEQAGFRRNYSTTDHIFTISELISRSVEYNFPLYLVFVDYLKAFDSIEFGSLWKALLNQGVHAKLICVLKDVYERGKVFVRLGKEKVRIHVERGVRQGDPLSPHLFNCVLEEAMKQVNWNQYGVNINGKRLHHLRYADDLVLISHDPKEVQNMLGDLCRESRKVGLVVNIQKTVAMSNRTLYPFTIDHQSLKYVTNFIYLGVRISFDQDTMLEVNRRVGSAWKGFNRFYNFLTNRRVEMGFKERVYKMCIEPALIYGSELWSLTKKVRNRLVVVQRSMMRKMAGITRMERRSNEWLSQKVPLPDVRIQAMLRKWNWARRLALTEDERWDKLIMEWTPIDRTRPIGRPKTRWRDELTELLGVNWQSICRRDPNAWNLAIIQQAQSLNIE